jgi:hypothetical protein
MNNQKISETEKEIVISLTDFSGRRCEKLINFINGLKLKDLFDGTSYFEIISCIYLNKKTSRLRADVQAEILHMDVRTLFNHRKKLVEFYKKLDSFIPYK